MDYTAEITFPGTFTDDATDAAITMAIDFHPAITTVNARTTLLILTAPAETLRQATNILHDVAVNAVGKEPISIEVMRTAEWDRREGFEPMPELVSVTDAAGRLGVTRQAVLQRIEAGSLPGTKVGKTWVIPASAL